MKGGGGRRGEGRELDEWWMKKKEGKKMEK